MDIYIVLCTMVSDLRYLLVIIKPYDEYVVSSVSEARRKC